MNSILALLQIRKRTATDIQAAPASARELRSSGSNPSQKKIQLKESDQKGD
jgi:hypothetical protein